MLILAYRHDMVKQEALSTCMQVHQSLKAMRIDELDRLNYLFMESYPSDIRERFIHLSLLTPNIAIARSAEWKYMITVRDGKGKSIDVKKELAGKDSQKVFCALVISDHILTKVNDYIKDSTVIN